MLRRLRYLPAAFFALLVLAFIALWVRSYTWVDTIIGPLGEARTFSWGSVNGIFAAGVSGNSRSEEWSMQSHPSRPRTVSRWQRSVLFGLERRLQPTSAARLLGLPDPRRVRRPLLFFRSAYGLTPEQQRS
jgi:hypothetical protein